MVLSADAEIMRWPCLPDGRSEEHTSELQSDQISYAVFCLKKNVHRHLSLAAQVQASQPGFPCVGSGYSWLQEFLFHVFFFNVTATTKIYVLSLHAAFR